MKSTVLRICVLLGLLSLTITTYSQSIIRSSINCFGGSHMSDGLLLRQTGGQASNTESLINGQLIRQGFQQPIVFTFQSSVKKKSITLSLFPNPATIETKLTLSEEIGEYQIVVSDITGKKINIIKTNKTENRIDSSELPIGICIISVVKDGEVLSNLKLVVTN